MQRLKGKIAVITGGTSGIGLATAKLFVADGAFGFITGRRKPELSAAEAESAGGAPVDRLFERVREMKGRIDVL